MVVSLTVWQLIALMAASISTSFAAFFWCLSRATCRDNEPGGCFGRGIAFLATTVGVGFLALAMFVG